MITDEFIKYLVVTIAVWRVTHLFSSEDGPFDMIFKFRRMLGESFLGKLMDCFYCLSIWTGLAASILTGRNLMEILLLCLYYSGISIILERLTNKNFIN